LFILLCLFVYFILLSTDIPLKCLPRVENSKTKSCRLQVLKTTHIVTAMTLLVSSLWIVSSLVISARHLAGAQTQSAWRVANYFKNACVLYVWL